MPRPLVQLGVAWTALYARCSRREPLAIVLGIVAFPLLIALSIFAIMLDMPFELARRVLDWWDGDAQPPRDPSELPAEKRK
jgi:hypothetical protein